MERHGIDVRNLEAGVEGGRAHYRAQVEITPPHDVHAALTEVARLPGVEKISASGLNVPELRSYETQAGPEQ